MEYTDFMEEVAQLSRDIADFAWDYDPYEFNDEFGDDYVDNKTKYAWNTQLAILDNKASYIREFLQEAIIASGGYQPFTSTAQKLLQRFDNLDRKILLAWQKAKARVSEESF